MKKKNLPNVPENAKLMDENTPYAIKEAFNQLRINIMYHPNNSEGCPVYGITSAEMGVGKSTVIANLAVSFAQLGQRVLIVDADMRRPTQHKILGVGHKSNGFSELLSDIIKDDASVMKNSRENVSVITSGALPPNPSALMLSKKVGELIEKWKREFDIIFIDLPPVGIVTDPLTISDKLTGYIIVATVNKSDARYLNAAIDAINQIGADIVGLVINGADPKGNDYNYKYQYKRKNTDSAYY